MAGAVPDMSYPEGLVSGKAWISRMASQGTLAGMGLWGCPKILAELVGPLLWAQARALSILSPSSWEATAQCTDLYRDPLLSQAAQHGEGAGS